MKHITLLAIEGSNLSSLDQPRRAFLEVNRFLEQQNQSPAFQVQTAGLHATVELDQGLFTIHPDIQIQQLHHTDLIIIPSCEVHDIAHTLQRNQEYIPWLKAQYANGSEIASLCLGTFLLAATGLLRGKTCATHWQAIPLFQQWFSDIQVVTDRILTDESGLYTSGGAFSSANLIVYLIEKFIGHEAAIHCVKLFQVDMDRHSQSPFMIFQGYKHHADETVKKAQAFIEQYYAQRISIFQLCETFAISRRNLERRFKQATGYTVGAYIQRVRMEAARKKLENSLCTIYEVMYDVGYQDHKAFREAFKKITGLSPLQYRNRYGKHWFAPSQGQIAGDQLN
ncbi:GlxA family transcriptional regulator [Thermoflavifilum thermophilum]|uniref:Transcriptional regulator GlxA family, contains an amidase domain and an AraC-type DNA-binding HTH domain n=1 Tax=Thermoflavifilum thermophilum TaxID=1393122 RepID=A0A1I7NJZ9_9BACT|nr:helix-turn-helix domain-containing protein [Thermoflavifilum thermophilum]SFV34967.1 Transcriptional regulator GlxA family, contains an amidase domain and an AraC-type DNA-binding HTH domain [Thermoflavifilum thermophilum]